MESQKPTPSEKRIQRKLQSQLSWCSDGTDLSDSRVLFFSHMVLAKQTITADVHFITVKLRDTENEVCCRCHTTICKC